MNFFIERALADSSSSDAASAMGLLIGGGVLFIWIIVAIVALIGLILWIWALVDCLKKEFPGSEKTTWIVVLALTFFFGFGWLGAIIYLIVGRPKGKYREEAEKIKIENKKEEEKKSDTKKEPHDK